MNIHNCLDNECRKEIFQDLNPNWTFENFMICPSNKKAYDNALETSRGGSSPLIIYGQVGMGKTHLLHAIGHRLKESGGKVGYLSGEAFCIEFWRSIKRNHETCFSMKFESLDVLLVDYYYPLMDKDFQMKESRSVFLKIVKSFLNQSKLVVVTVCPAPRRKTIFDDWNIVKIGCLNNKSKKLFLKRCISDWIENPLPNHIFEYMVQLSERASHFREINNMVIVLSGWLRYREEKLTHDLEDLKTCFSKYETLCL